MNVSAAMAHLLKREGVEFLVAYPTNPLIESAARAGIRTVIVRQERVTRPEELASAMWRGIELTWEGTPVLLEFAQ